ncbi:MAG: PHP domain-containing protein [Gammaproteobacteria bacterium]|nr:PHP domain-containing protein [Gammaproteobacteria bacterium]
MYTTIEKVYHDKVNHGRPLRYDLHMHSSVSDGILEPAALVERVAEAGIDVMALTDHDTTDGVKAAARAGFARGVRVIAGAEISVSWQGGLLHILALGVDLRDPTLQQGLALLRERREERAVAMGERLAASGIEGCLDGARGYAGGSSIGRSHFAADLVARGFAKDRAAAFRKFLRPGKPGYVSCQWASLESAVAWIKGAGGRAVIAHPARYRLTATKMGRLCEEFKSLGGDGIEVVSGTHTPHDNAMAAGMAQRFELLASQGSDFHDPAQTWLGFGSLPALPENLTPVWHDWGHCAETREYRVGRTG